MNDISLKVKTVVEILILPILAFGVMLLSDMNKNIQDLNTKVAVILVDNNHAKDKLKDLDERVKDLEKGSK